MQFETTVQIDAPAEQVWARLVDLAAWPTWTKSMRSVTPEGSGPLAVGTRATVRQPGLPPTTWTVTDVDPGTAFTWVSKAPGVHTTATHRLERSGATTMVTLGVDQRGVAAGLVALVLGARTRRYVQMEADGLKAAAEAPPHI